MPRQMIRCRWCPWRMPLFQKLKNGRSRMNYPSLVRHIENDHPEQFQELVTSDVEWRQNVSGECSNENAVVGTIALVGDEYR